MEDVDRNVSTVNPRDEDSLMAYGRQRNDARRVRELKHRL
jgi:hypothetical protein